MTHLLSIVARHQLDSCQVEKRVIPLTKFNALIDDRYIMIDRYMISSKWKNCPCILKSFMRNLYHEFSNLLSLKNYLKLSEFSGKISIKQMSDFFQCRCKHTYCTKPFQMKKSYQLYVSSAILFKWILGPLVNRRKQTSDCLLVHDIHISSKWTTCKFTNYFFVINAVITKNHGDVNIPTNLRGEPIDF